MPSTLPMSEDELEAAVEGLARTFGWLAYHTRRSKGSEPGFPDLVMLRGGHQLVVELKRDGEHPTPAQARWLDEFARAGVTTAVWRPDDWRDGTIEETLRPTRRR